jgi:subtilisin family serine protease
VVNISLGIKQKCQNPRISENGSLETPSCQAPITEGAKVKAAMKKAIAENQMLFVVSAGNSSEEKRASQDDGIIVVGAMDERGHTSDYSNYGSAVSIYAPDWQIWGTTYDDYKTDLGTSFTTPLVTAAAALAMMYLEAHNISYTATQIQNLLLVTARPQSGLAHKSYVAGSVDYLRMAQTLLTTHDSLH